MASDPVVNDANSIYGGGDSYAKSGAIGTGWVNQGYQAPPTQQETGLSGSDHNRATNVFNGVEQP